MGVFNRKQKRFINNKMSNQERAELLALEINKKVSETTSKEIAKAFYKGFMYSNYILDRDYLEPMSKIENQEDFQAKFKEMVSHISMYAKKYSEEIKEDSEEIDNVTNDDNKRTVDEEARA